MRTQDLDYTQGDTQIASFTAQTDVAGRTIAQASTGSAQEFTFDDLGRLRRTQDQRGGACTTRTYGFDAASNRTSWRSYDPTEDGQCQTTTPATSRDSNYDSAGRARNSGYSYDTFGRTLTLPGTDTTTPKAGEAHLTYAVDDMVATITKNTPTSVNTTTSGSSGSTTATTGSSDNTDNTAATSVEKRTYTLDPLRRVQTITTTRGGVETQRLRYRYTNETDSPALIEASNDQGTTWSTTRYITAPGIGFAAATTSGANANPASLNITNLHGDVVATIVATPGSNILDHWTETDEYGNPASKTTAENNSTGGSSAVRYGYLGGHQRSTDTPNNALTLMGARLYNPANGSFLTADPVLDGGDNRYGYPTDPINRFDLTGEMWRWVFNAGIAALGAVVGLAGSLCGPLYMICSVAGGAMVGALEYIGRRKYVDHRSWSKSGAVSAGLAGAAGGVSGGIFGRLFGLQVTKAFVGSGRHMTRRLVDRLASKLYSLSWDFLGGLVWYVFYAIADRVARRYAR